MPHENMEPVGGRRYITVNVEKALQQTVYVIYDAKRLTYAP